MDHSHLGDNNPSPNIEMFAAEIFQGISIHLENSPEQGQEPAPSTRWFDPNHQLLYIPAVPINTVEAGHYPRVIPPQAGLVHLRIHNDSEDAATWQSEWDSPREEDAGGFTWKELTVMLTLAGMVWQHLFL